MDWGSIHGVADSVIEPGLGTQAPFGKWAYVGVHTWEEKSGFAFSVGRKPWIMRLPPPPRPRCQCCPRGWRVPSPPNTPMSMLIFFLSLRSQQRLCGLASRAHRRSLAPTLKLGARGGRASLRAGAYSNQHMAVPFFPPMYGPPIQFESKTKKESIPLISQTRAARGVNKPPGSTKLSELGVNGGSRSRAGSRGWAKATMAKWRQAGLA